MSRALIEDYLSLEEILASHERVPCKFELTVFKLGFLDPSSESSDLLPGTKLELPLWLAGHLQSKRIVSIDVPKIYREAYREILSADASVVDLYRLAPHFFEFGLHFLKTKPVDSLEIGTTLIQTFKKRFRRIMDCSQNAVMEDTSLLTARLDHSERSLFVLGQKAVFHFQKWQKRKSRMITASAMVVSHRKRKRTEL